MVESITAVVEDMTATRLAGGGDTEGPLWHPDGSVTFVRLDKHELVRWSPDGEVSVIRRETGEGNGCTLDRQSRLLMCEGLNRRVTRREPDGTWHVLADRYRGAALNKPNDVVTRSDGTVYFTDPQARVPPPQRELGFSGVFFVAPDATELQLGTDACEYPNGLAFSPDESLLYVAITRRDEGCLDEIRDGGFCPHQWIRVFDVHADGSLTGNRIFADLSGYGPGRPDGIKVDRDGRVYCTAGDGIWVFDPSGARIGVITVPEPPRNFAFGGPHRCQLYVCAGTSLYRIATRVHGIAAC